MPNVKQEPLSRRRLGFFPTPVTELRKLSERLEGPRILIKRDDQSGLAFGGNKVRKLEFLIGEALGQDCDSLITAGAAQSNHCRQTAAAAAACGMECHLALGGQAPDNWNGNLILNKILGANIHWTGSFRKGETIPDIAASLSESGRKPYVIPYGGSNSVGAIGFVEAARELKAQLEELDEKISHIVIASSSGGTQAGLMVGKHLFEHDFEIIGIGIDKEELDIPFEEQVLRLAASTAERVGAKIEFSASDVILNNDFLGSGYGVVGDTERRAIRLTAETEGILLDPVYTGRAMGALIGMIEQGRFSGADSVMFWHTGGSPALFSYADTILQTG